MRVYLLLLLLPLGSLAWFVVVVVGIGTGSEG
jgi:hypothetical protein